MAKRHRIGPRSVGASQEGPSEGEPLGPAEAGAADQGTSGPVEEGLEVDFVSALTDFDSVDFVDAVFGSRHYLNCDYRPLIRRGQTVKVGDREVTLPDDGLIYCEACGQQIGSLTPPSEYTCLHCGDHLTSHVDGEGRCRMEGCDCPRAVRRGEQ